MQACLGRELKNAETLMAGRLHRLMACLSSEQKKQLRQAQSAWLCFRQKNADFEASGEKGGTLFALERLSILLEMTRSRAEELNKHHLKLCNQNLK